MRYNMESNIMSELRGFHRDEKGIHGVACARSLTPSLHIIIMASDMNKLHEAWELISCGKKTEGLNEFLCKYVIGLDEGKVQPELKKKIEEDVWIRHPESDCVFIGLRSDLEKDTTLVELGLAIRKTTTEAKIYLRANGWSREEIETQSFHTEENFDYTEDDIPF